ncbi:hypothetical protein EBQ25_08620 [Allofranklinella schreckenbergeri]|uniref:Uncharacterized protein n=1 Tax=Allofranklinella schreckenbergeri TaxID=1076744 RepID=A0A3M6Q8I8_9BURK|nr:hypothetical protein [Allofranklinella schreckenbergeri]RMW98771.1 hypothetical protein EBQ25_08620 [Allofranklinella schreckenbergeri]
MKKQDISTAKDADLRASQAAMQRAAALARQVAIQTNTAIVVEQDGKAVRVTADELRRKQEQRKP